MPKVQKQKGKAPEKVCHPYSRKAAYLAREEIRIDKKDRQRTEKASRLNTIRDKLLWFKDRLEPTKVAYTKQEACDIVESYLQRFDSELEQIDLVNGIKGRQGRSHGARENHIQQTIEREKALYEGNGFEIPDIMNAKHLKFFRDWNGDLKKLPNIKFRKISSKGVDRTQGEEKSVVGDEDKGIEELDVYDDDEEDEEGGGDKELVVETTE